MTGETVEAIAEKETRSTYVACEDNVKGMA